MKLFSRNPLFNNLSGERVKKGYIIPRPLQLTQVNRFEAVSLTHDHIFAFRRPQAALLCEWVAISLYMFLRYDISQYAMETPQHILHSRGCEAHHR